MLRRSLQILFLFCFIAIGDKSFNVLGEDKFFKGLNILIFLVLSI